MCKIWDTESSPLTVCIARSTFPCFFSIPHHIRRDPSSCYTSSQGQENDNKRELELVVIRVNGGSYAPASPLSHFSRPPRERRAPSRRRRRSASGAAVMAGRCACRVTGATPRSTTWSGGGSIAALADRLTGRVDSRYR